MATPAQKATVFGVVILLVFVAGGVFWAHQGVSEGYVGVELNRGAATGEVYEPDWHFINPITESIVMIETRPIALTMRGDDEIYAITTDGQDVWIDVTIRYRVEQDEAVTFYREYRNHGQAQDRVIDPTVRSTVRDEVGGTTAEEIINRDERIALQNAVHESLEENVQGTGVTIEAVQIRNVRLNDQFATALEEVEIEQQRAQQRIIESESQAEANEIRDRSLTDAVLMEKHIDSIDESDTVILATDGDGTPIILNPDQSGGDGMAGLNQDVPLNESVNENESDGDGSEEESADA